MKKKIDNMKKMVYLLLALAVIACGNKTAGTMKDADSAKMIDDTKAETNEDYTPQRADYSFRTEVRTINEDGDVRWDSIIVYLTDARGHTQELYSQAQPLDTTNWEKGSIGEILEDDWNFDGIPDLQVCTGPMNGFGNFTYDVWLWNDKAHHFEELKDNCEIYSPEIDFGNKCIVSVWRLDDEVEIIRYKWKEGKLVETERQQMSYEDLVED